MLLTFSFFLLLSHPPVLLSNGALKTIAFCVPRPNDLRALKYILTIRTNTYVKNTYIMPKCGKRAIVLSLIICITAFTIIL